MLSQKLRGFLALFLCAAIFGSFGIFVRLLGQSFTSLQQVFLRNLVATTFILSFVLVTRKKMQYHGVPIKTLFWYAIVFPLEVICFTIAIQYIKVSTATFIFYGANLGASAVIGNIFYKEHIKPHVIVALLISLLGLLMYAYPFELGDSLIGIAWITAAGLFDAIVSAFSKLLGGKLDTWSATPLRTGMGVIISGIGILLMHESFIIQSFTPTSVIVLLIFGSMLFAINTLTLYGFKRFDLNLGTFVLSAEVVFATIFGILVIHELPLVQEWIGAAFMSLGIIIANYPVLRSSLRKNRLSMSSRTNEVRSGI